MKPRLFDKLDTVNPQWHTCQKGHTACSGGLFLTTEEFSRLGVLLLNKGIYNDQQIMTADFVKKMHSNRIDTSYKLDIESRQGYGYLVWNCTLENSYRADGMYRQTCIVLEDYNAVITFTGHNEEYGQETLRTIWHDVLPHLKL